MAYVGSGSCFDEKYSLFVVVHYEKSVCWHVASLLDYPSTEFATFFLPVASINWFLLWSHTILLQDYLVVSGGKLFLFKCFIVKSAKCHIRLLFKCGSVIAHNLLILRHTSEIILWKNTTLFVWILNFSIRANISTSMLYYGVTILICL